MNLKQVCEDTDKALALAQELMKKSNDKTLQDGELKEAMDVIIFRCERVRDQLHQALSEIHDG